MTRRGWFFTTYFAVTGVGLSMVLHPKPRLIWNATASVPVGLYRLHPERAPHVGDLVALRLPEGDANMLARGGYLPRGVPLLKPVAAVGGQSVCRFGSRVMIDGRAVGDAFSVDHRRRPLPVWQGCHRLDAREIFVMNAREPRSLDGRYFGPVPVSNVIGRATPLWIGAGPSPSHASKDH
ncbi:S26 family signal peptidase [Komagataeibacter oboediens]|uniref:S26 family signal peptidase n=1 Tax=Komagataeibacter oboediens TaxID=65958 RepID=UPI001C2C1F29|nr:S26 family signal peptidase [Komagataeibacter oboediens]MBV0888825.1 S26 family signal peptidase [Komagataeibacter oboediens]MCK9821529.1 S26 family signal peptidase [Komagataeibacter oboediens]